MHCAQEILSSFMLAIFENIQRVGGITARLPISDEQSKLYRENRTETFRAMENSVFRKLAQDIVDAGMARDLTDAYTLVIPAFAHHKLLPSEADSQDGAQTPTKADSEEPNDHVEEREALREMAATASTE
ncbi:hypothetical protein OQA88_2967 [Cercophora sp. LCS_1]